MQPGLQMEQEREGASSFHAMLDLNLDNQFREITVRKLKGPYWKNGQ